MHPQNNTIKLLMLTEQFECYLKVWWKANFDCCLDGNSNSIWRCLSTPAESRYLLFLLMFLKYVTFPEGDRITKKLQRHGHQREAQRTAVIFIFAPASVKVRFDCGLLIIGLQSAQHKLNKRANPETALTETVTSMFTIYLCGCPQNRMIRSKLRSKLPTVV